MPAQQQQPEGAHQHGDWRKAQQGGILLAALDDDSGDVGKRKPHQQPRPRHGQRVGVAQQRGQWRPTGGVLRGRDVAAGMAQLLPVPPDKAAVVAQQPVAPQLPPAAQRALLQPGGKCRIVACQQGIAYGGVAVAADAFGKTVTVIAGVREVVRLYPVAAVGKIGIGEQRL